MSLTKTMGKPLWRGSVVEPANANFNIFLLQDTILFKSEESEMGQSDKFKQRQVVV